MNKIDHIAVGKIIGSWGRKGEVKLFPYTDYPERFDYLKEAYLSDGKCRQEVYVEFARQYKNIVIIKFRGIESISEAEKMAGANLEVKRKDAVRLPQGTYYICDVLGSEVRTVEGKYVGVLKDVLKQSAHDVYVINTQDGKEVLIPAVKEFVKSIDIDARLIKIKPIKGMLNDAEI